jgi:succinate dehydrogenase/fumarate reductase flavoprotein subunit
MNAPAIELYRSKGLDITKEPLEIALCAQHNNGGIAVDLWWQTEISGLFAAGECAGTHGVSRPGGSALNAGQVGSLRAAQWVCASSRAYSSEAAFHALATDAVSRHKSFCQAALEHEDNATASIQAAQRRMSDSGGAIRDREAMEKAFAEIRGELENLQGNVGVRNVGSLYRAYKLKDLLTVQYAVLAAMIDFSKTVGTTRGSALYCDKAGDLREGLEELFRFRLDATGTNASVQQVRLQDNAAEVTWRPVRPMPTGDDFFENVWRQYRENKNIY